MHEISNHMIIIIFVTGRGRSISTSGSSNSPTLAGSEPQDETEMQDYHSWLDGHRWETSKMFLTSSANYEIVVVNVLGLQMF